MKLIKKMNNYIQHQESQCECNKYKNKNSTNDAVDAFNFLTELFPQFKNNDWKKTTAEALDKLSSSNLIFNEDMFKKFYQPETYTTTTTEPSWNATHVKKVVYNDYERNVNVLYAQLALVIQEVCTTLMLGSQISQDEWENLSRKIMHAYNYAAKDTGYYMDVTKKTEE